MAVVSFTVQFSGGALGPGAYSGDWVMDGTPDRGSVAITAIPSTLGGLLSVENIRVTRARDSFGDPIIRRVLCQVHNTGSFTVTSYVVNYAVMAP